MITGTVIAVLAAGSAILYATALLVLVICAAAVLIVLAIERLGEAVERQFRDHDQSLRAEVTAVRHLVAKIAGK